jgi:hypothetical protein
VILRNGFGDGIMCNEVEVVCQRSCKVIDLLCLFFFLSASVDKSILYTLAHLPEGLASSENRSIRYWFRPQ